jgi:coenzyme F420-reducing hydrogenase alpha subunit
MSEKGIQTLDRQAKAIEHYEAALETVMGLYSIRVEAWEHWNKARAILANAEISESDAVHLEKPDASQPN